MQDLFRGIFDTEFTVVISVTDFLLCIGVALALGLIIALTYTYRTRFTKSHVITLALLPAVVAVVIMMVNGNIGAGVAVAGAFSLVRFRSAPGSAKEITALFLAMGAGLVVGMGYLAFAALFTLILCLFLLLYSHLSFGARWGTAYKTVTITIPEDLDYSEVFDDLFREYTSSFELLRVKTVNMGSLFRLTYQIALRDPKKEKELIDQLRCRNANLEITVSRQETSDGQL